jgi:DMSO/TMAO reductase YedYZ heme-binding membrane subunit
MKDLLRNNRFYILVFSLILSFVIACMVSLTIDSPQLQIIRLNQIYGFISIGFLYFAMLAGPLCYTFPQFPLKKHYLHARRAIGVSAFYFGLLHTLLGFFEQLGGFAGLGFLSTNFIIATGLGVIGLFILLLLAATSFDVVIKKMTFPVWKLLQQFVYLAGLLILVHTVIIGTHFANVSTVIPQVFFAMVAVLLLFEANHFDAFLAKRFPLPRFGITASLLIGSIAFSYVYSLLPSGATIPLGIHAQHEQLAGDAQQNGGINVNLPAIPSLQGDKTLRYTVGLIKPDQIQPNQETSLRFQVYNADNGSEVRLFQNIYSKQAHLVIVDNELQYFTHVHPQLQGNIFTINTKFPHPGLYRLYLNYQPVNAIEQQVAFSVRVGISDNQAVTFAQQNIDTNLTKTVDTYAVHLDTSTLKADDMSTGNQRITFTLTDAKTKKPVTNVKPYLGAFGHLVMINKETYTFIHVHPTATVADENQTGGPSVTFMPFGLYGPIKPGVYRIFAEFNPDNHLIVPDFTVKVE